MSREEREMRAGDYVLGLMDDADRTRAERDLIIDPEFRDAVWSFAGRMESLDGNATVEAPGDALWQKVSDEISGIEQMTRTQAVQDDLAAAGVPIRQPDRHGHLGLKRPMARLFTGARGTALAASILAACGFGYVVGQASVTARDPEVVVVLLGEDDVPGALVEAYANDRVRIVPLTDFDVPDGKVLEVWTLYDEAVGPVSLGTMASAREAMLTGPDLPEPQPQQLYEITLEDAPRSSAGRPLGPILVKGLAVSPPR
ncbi:anti-sigma factor [Aliihoeflea sp. PC F10.4]